MDNQSNPNTGPTQGPNPFAGFNANSEQARRVYIKFNDRVQTLRAQPSWVHKLIGYTALLVITGVLIVLAAVGLVVGAALAIVVAIVMGIRKLGQLITGNNTPAGPRDSGRSANIRVLTRR